MTPTAPTVPAAPPRAAALPRDVAMRLAATEYDRFTEQLRRLAPADWARPTDCPLWDVHAMAAHVLGMAKMSASVRELVRQNRSAARAGGVFIDALTALQVAEHAHLTPAQVVDELASVGPRAARGRRRAPRLVRRRRMTPDQPVGDRLEPWTVGYLVDVILTRDPWMHRIDIARAVGAEPTLTADHDGVLVDDVVREWAQRHGQPCTLVLTGAAGGRWSWGTGGPTLECDAVEFCRGVSGRGAVDGLLAEPVPF